MKPASDAVLEKTFDPAAPDSENGNTATYDDVRTDTRDYKADIEPTNTEVEDTSQASETVSIGDTDEAMVGIALGSDESVAIRVGASLSDSAETES